LFAYQSRTYEYQLDILHIK